jgi:hypothetical protein
MKMKALKTFLPNGGKIVKQGEEFSTTDQKANEYERLGLAERTGTTKTSNKTPQTQETQAMETHETFTEKELKEKNVSELKQVAKDKGVTGYSSMTKSELIFAILASQN